VALALKKRHLSSLAYSGWFDIGVIAAFGFGYSCCFSLSFSYFLPITHLIVAITPPPASIYFIFSSSLLSRQNGKALMLHLDFKSYVDFFSTPPGVWKKGRNEESHPCPSGISGKFLVFPGAAVLLYWEGGRVRRDRVTVAAEHSASYYISSNAQMD